MNGMNGMNETPYWGSLRIQESAGDCKFFCCTPRVLKRISPELLNAGKEWGG